MALKVLESAESFSLDGKPKSLFACVIRQVVANLRMNLNPLRVYVQYDNRH